MDELSLSIVVEPFCFGNWPTVPLRPAISFLSFSTRADLEVASPIESLFFFWFKTSKAMERVVAAVVGGGFAGLQATLALKQEGIRHLVLEKHDKPLHSWRTERWDSFRMNTPHWANRMIGQKDDVDDDATAMPVGEMLALWDEFLCLQDLPLLLNCVVTEVSRCADGGGYLLKWLGKDGTEHQVVAENVIVATGALQDPKIPPFAARIPSSVRQFSAWTYKSPEDLLDGPVLVVGAGQTGVQIADELASQESSRVVYLATSKIAAVPRTFMGKDVVTALRDVGFLATPRAALPPERLEKPTPPQVGASKSISYHSLWRNGVQLLGRLEDVENCRAQFGDDLRSNILHADESYRGLCLMLANHLSTSADHEHLDSAFEPSSELLEYADHAPQNLLLGSGGIMNVVWACGMDTEYAWLRVPLGSFLDKNNLPIGWAHPEQPGLYWLGFYNQRTAGSNFLCGFCEDAKLIAAQVSASSKTTT